MNKSNVASKTITISSLSVVFILLTTLILFVYIDKINRDRVIQDRLNLEVDALQVNINESYILGDLISLRKYLDTFAKMNYWTKGELQDQFGKILWTQQVQPATTKSNIEHDVVIKTNSGGNLGRIRFTKDLQKENKKFDERLMLSLLGLGLIAIIGLFVQTLTLFKILKPVTELTINIKEEASSLGLKLEEHTGYDEIYLIKKWFNDVTLSWRKEKERASEESKYSGMVMIASQVSHDIRSPLSALNMIIGSLHNIPEEQRIMLRSATNRITDIANQLLKKSNSIRVKNSNVDKDEFIKSESKLSTELIPAIVDIMVSEKRVQYRERNKIVIEADLLNSYGSFANINSTEFKRVISNTINNSVEAMHQKDGKIVVSVKNIEGKVRVSITDNGSGIPKHILEKLGEIGISYGKQGTESGSGLGIYHAKKAIESFGAQFQILSQEGIGTEIRMDFPNCEIPKWFVPSLKLKQEQNVITLDDDKSILEIWKQRFKPFEYINLISFTSEKEFVNWIKLNPELKHQSIFLMDYELLGQEKTGLDLIETLNLSKNAYLVTSRYDELRIRERCEKLNVKQIPKGMASLVPINIIEAKLDQLIFENSLVIQSNVTEAKPLSTKDSGSLIRYDLCLLDDDRDLVQTTWDISAKNIGLSIKMFTTPQEFFAASETIDRRTPIYVDVSLGNGINGTDVANEIHKLGFIEINLATGHDANTIEVPDFINRVCGKEFPLET